MALSEWSLGTSERGLSCGANSGTQYNVYIAKVLPLVGFGMPAVTPVGLNQTCLINDGSCMPSVGGVISTRNFIEVPVASNAQKIKSVDHGYGLNIEVRSKNVDKLYVTGITEA